MNKNAVSDALRTGLGRRPGRVMRIVLLAVATAVFFFLARHARYAMIDEFTGNYVAQMQILSGVIFGAIYAVSLAVQLHAGKRLPLLMHILLAAVTGAVLLGKISLLDYVSDDYDIFLSGWIYSYSQMGFKEGLGTYIASDYSPPYLYLLQAISHVEGYPPQYLVKVISMAFEVLLSYALMKLVSLGGKGEGTQLLVYQLTSLLPTVVFNGAYWGQCDVIYTAFCLLAICMALQKHSARSMVCFGLALSFKFQTVFFLPVLLPLWLRRDIRLRHLVLIPATYMVMMLPALWGGKSMHHVLTVYLQQAGNYSFITMNAPNLYQFLPKLDKAMLYDMFGAMAMMLGFACLLAVCLLLSVYRRRITVDAALLACLLVLVGIPTFLPKMHERYTFGADVLSLAAAAYAPKRRFLLPLCLGFASYAAYTAGLPGEAIVNLKWAALFQLAGVALAAAELWRVLHEDGQEAALAEVKA